MEQVRLSLDGAWDFQMAPDADPERKMDAPAGAGWRTATVPMPWQAQFDDLRHASGTAWYRRRVEIDASVNPGESAAILHFGAVDYHATVWLNGVLVGEHEGGYLPFEFDVAHLLRPGANELTVRVIDASDDRALYPDFPFSEVPHGKQSWYGPIGGIWQSVWLELRPRLHIRHVRLTPDPATATIHVAAHLSAPLASGVLAAVAYGPDGGEVARGLLDASGAGTLTLAAPAQLWSPETPNLYSVEVSLDGAQPCTLRGTCGFRTVEARDGRIFLNGEPIYLRAVLDQGYYPDTIYTPPSLEYLEEQARTAKAIGLNCLRIHIKVEDPRYYEVADRLGLLVWTEIPNWALLTDEASRRGKETFAAMLERDGNHPSIIIWTLINENWGTDLVRNPEHRRWLAQFFHEARAMDPTRLVVDNSACCDNLHVAGHLEDFHHYRALPDHAKEWDEWVADFAGRADWVWADDHAHERKADAPLIVSEFGNWGLPNPPDTHEKGGEPWWFETGFDWGQGIVYPHGVERRFAEAGLGAIWPSFADFARAAQVHMVRSLHYEISTMRLHESIGGYVITEFTDVHWEGNGLLTMQRKPKADVETRFAELNQDRVVVLRPANWSALPGKTADVLVSTQGRNGHESGGVIHWQADAQSGQLAAPGGTIQVPMESPGTVTLRARWLADDGSEIAANQVELVCVQPLAPGDTLRVVGNDALADVLRSLGYTVRVGLPQGAAAQDEILVAQQYTQTIKELVQAGARLLLLAGDTSFGTAEESGTALATGAVVPREGTPWQGDWANSISWVRKQGPLSHLPGPALLEMEWAAIMPDAVIVGLPPWALRDHSWAGLAVGWLHRAVSLLARVHYGRGAMVTTTFKLNATTLAGDAMAQALFSSIVQLL